MDVLVDKTAANSVIARDQAIAEMAGAAFQKLAERNNSKAKAPKNVSDLVENFEIRDEHMSSTRYVAHFTVRFSNAVRNYIDIQETAAPPSTAPGMVGAISDALVAEQPEDGAPAAPRLQPPAANGAAAQPADDSEPIGKAVLVLPYYENASGQTLLWEDPNPWRGIWQNALPPSAPGRTQFTVPLGDISDIAAGPSNGVWSGDYGAVEKLRAAYHADEVVLAVATSSDRSVTVDIYTFRAERLKHRGSLTAYAGDMADEEALRKAMFDTLRYLQQQPRQRPSLQTVESISREVVGSHDFGTTVIDSRGNTQAPVLKPPAGIVWQDQLPSSAQQPSRMPPQQQYAPQYTPQYAPRNTSQNTAPPAPQYAPQYAQQPAPAPTGGAQIDAAAYFPDFRGWVELQRRLGTLTPALSTSVRSLDSNHAELSLSYDGSMGTLRDALAAHGVAISGGGGSFSLSLAN